MSPPPVIVALVTKSGCPACIEYKPRWQRAIARYPAVYFVELDVETTDPHVNAFLDRAGVQNVPSVVIAPLGTGNPVLLEQPTDWVLHEWLVVARRMTTGA